MLRLGTIHLKRKNILLKLWAEEWNQFVHIPKAVELRSYRPLTVKQFQLLMICLCVFVKWSLWIALPSLALAGTVHSSTKCTKTSLISQCHYQILFLLWEGANKLYEKCINNALQFFIKWTIELHLKITFFKLMRPI